MFFGLVCIGTMKKVRPTNIARSNGGMIVAFSFSDLFLLPSKVRSRVVLKMNDFDSDMSSQSSLYPV